MRQLPNTLHELIRVAIADLEKAEQSENYIINMHRWHTSREDVCSVCLAGSVMAETLGANPLQDLVPEDFDDRVKLTALECLRQGDICSAAEDLGIKPPIIKRALITPYGNDPEQFKKDMLKLADLLEHIERGEIND